MIKGIWSKKNEECEGDLSIDEQEDRELEGEVEPDVFLLTDGEAEHWGRLYAESKMHSNQAKIYAYMQKEVQLQFEQKINALRAELNKRVADLEKLKQSSLSEAKFVHQQYDEVTDKLCERYNIDRKYAVIDVESREMREETP